MIMDGLAGTLTNKQKLSDILSAFPDDGIDHAFGYGSGVFVQEETEEITNSNRNNHNDAMVDIILSVSNPTAWHHQNLERNSNHYAALPRTFGPTFISTVQNQGAGCYFNPMVQIETQAQTQIQARPEPASSPSLNSRRFERLVKYGVISTSTLKNDLMHWESMYIAGRMHKPVLHLELPSSASASSSSGDEILELQEEYNLRYALSTGLLLLPLHSSYNSYSSSNSMDKHISENIRATSTDEFEYGFAHKHKHQYQLSHLFECIAGISYINDPRIAAGAEDPNKIQKLVNSSGQLQRFHSLYKNQLSNLESMGLMSVVNTSTTTSASATSTCNGSVVEIQMDLNDTSVRKALYDNLPKNVQHFITASRKNKNNNINDTNVKMDLPSDNDMNEDVIIFARDLTVALGKIVGPPARIQSAKGIISAGILKSIQYASSKLTKGIFRNVKA